MYRNETNNILLWRSILVQKTKESKGHKPALQHYEKIGNTIVISIKALSEPGLTPLK